MNNHIEVLKLALEALEKMVDLAEWHDQAGYNAFKAGESAIAVIKQALAAPVQKGN